MERDSDSKEYYASFLYLIFVLGLVVTIVPLLLWIVAFIHIGVPSGLIVISYK